MQIIYIIYGKIYKELVQLNGEKKKKQLKNGERKWPLPGHSLCLAVQVSLLYLSDTPSIQDEPLWVTLAIPLVWTGYLLLE